MARATLGMVKRIALRIVAALLITAGAVALGVAAWMAFTQHARNERETRSAEQLAAGKGRWIAVGDADLYIQEWGRADAPTVLLTHGTGAWSGTWFALPAALAEGGWRVVAVDLPPFGLSKTQRADTAVDYTRAAQARRLLRLIEQLGVPVTLVGHSFGAGPALEAAVLGGAPLRHLVLVDPALGLGPNGEPPSCDNAGEGGLLQQRPMRTALVSATATWPGLTALMLRQFVHRKEVVTEQLVPAYQLPFQRAGFSAVLGDWAASFARASCETALSHEPERLKRWAAGGLPIDLIWGEADTITPLAQGRALQRWMPGALLTTLSDVGHIPHIENPAAFATALLDAMRRTR
ncbi:MAG: alpha/beta hydrolase [Burkholderiaceae bacterium]